MTELKPCPFCGGEAIRAKWQNDYFQDRMSIACGELACPVKPVIRGLLSDVDKITKEWNTRQPAINWQPINEIEQYFNLGSDKFYRLLIVDANCNLYLGKDWERGYIFISGFFDDGVRVNLEQVKEKFTRFAEITLPNS